MVSLFFEHKGYGTRINGPVTVDRSPAFGAGMQALYMFTTPNTTKIKNYGGWRNNLTLQAGASVSVGVGGWRFKGSAVTTSYATTGATASTLAVTGGNKRTIFCRFRANQPSGASNVGGIWTYGDTTGTNSFLAIQQVNDASPNNAADSWAVNYGTAKLYITVPQTQNKIHSIVLTYDGNSFQVFVDGVQVGQATTQLNTTASPSFDVGRWLNSAGDVSINYFNGAIYQVGIVNVDWNARQVKAWHASPYRILRPRRTMIASPGPSFTPEIHLVGLPATGGFGVTVSTQTLLQANLTGLGATGGFGTAILFAQGSALLVSLSGLAAIDDFGGLILLNPGWNPVPTAGGVWTPVSSTSLTGA